MVTFRVPDMNCGHCASAIARAVASVDKRARLEVRIPEKLVLITAAATQQELAEAITEAGYPPETVGATPDPVRQPKGGSCCGDDPGSALARDSTRGL
jgi:copper chaperone